MISAIEHNLKCRNSAIVVPCYNEEKRINCNKYLNSLNHFDSHVFLVDDGSRDGTLNILKSLEKKAPDRFTAIKQSSNTGKAEAVRNGLNIAADKGFKYIGFADADLAVEFKEFPDFLKIFDDIKEVNTVIGTRTRLAGRKIDRNLSKYIQQRIIAKMGNVLFAPPVFDTQCGAKMFKAKVVKQAIKEPFLANWLFDQELLTRISKLKESIGKNWLFEFPVKSWIEYGGSHRKPSDYLKSLQDFFKILKKHGIKK